MTDDIPSDTSNTASDSTNESREEIADALRALRREVSAAVREGIVLATIQVDRARIWARDSAWVVGLAIVEAIAILVLLVVATLHFAAGICGAFAALFGTEWAGSLVGGLFGLAIAIGLLLWAKRRMEVASRERLRAKYEASSFERNAAERN